MGQPHNKAFKDLIVGLKNFRDSMQWVSVSMFDFLNKVKGAKKY